jgi:hypothetical protein
LMTPASAQTSACVKAAERQYQQCIRTALSGQKLCEERADAAAERT